MLANYHTHTKRCHHALGEDREYVEAAIEAGLEILGFSDHCPWVYPDGFVSGIRMTPAETEGYFNSLEQLKREYRNDIRILIGFEAEYTPELMEEQDALFDSYPLDYLILGQHFLGTDDYCYVGRPTDREDILSQYVDSVIEGMQSGRYLYLAHPDLIYFTGDKEIYDKYMYRLCRELKELDMPLELNVLGLADHRHYPAERFLKIAAETGNPFILGIDAHTPEQLRNQQAVGRAEELCGKYGIQLMDDRILL